MTPLRVVPGRDAERALWRTTMEVAALFADWPWVIIGAQMIMLLELEGGRPSGRTTRDLDVVVDSRLVVGVTRLAAGRLVKAGFEPSAEHPHRFVRGRDQVDLLAPDNLGARADLTTIAPRRTTQVAGGSRALATRRLVLTDVAGIGAGHLPLPSLAGAIVLKAHAFTARRARRDLDDLVCLLGLVPDVETVRAELKPGERRLLGSVSALHDPGHIAWSVVEDADDARAAFARLAD